MIRFFRNMEEMLNYELYMVWAKKGMQCGHLDNAWICVKTKHILLANTVFFPSPWCWLIGIVPNATLTVVDFFS